MTFYTWLIVTNKRQFENEAKNAQEAYLSALEHLNPNESIVNVYRKEWRS